MILAPFYPIVDQADASICISGRVLTEECIQRIATEARGLRQAGRKLMIQRCRFMSAEEEDSFGKILHLFTSIKFEKCRLSEKDVDILAPYFHSAEIRPTTLILYEVSLKCEAAISLAEFWYPGLSTIELYKCNVSRDGMVGIVSGLPCTLRHLALQEMMFTDSIIRAFSEAILAGLTTLAICGSTLGQQEFDAFCNHFGTHCKALSFLYLGFCRAKDCSRVVSFTKTNPRLSNLVFRHMQFCDVSFLHPICFYGKNLHFVSIYYNHNLTANSITNVSHLLLGYPIHVMVVGSRRTGHSLGLNFRFQSAPCRAITAVLGAQPPSPLAALPIELKRYLATFLFDQQ